MTAPKPGDRVRVTYEGKWLGDYARTLPTVGPSTVLTDGVGYDFPDVATVEVLANPVYVNHDTTEYRDGDVVKADHELNGRVWAYLSGYADEPWCSLEKEPRRRTRQTLPSRLRLLVRDGQVVA